MPIEFLDEVAEAIRDLGINVRTWRETPKADPAFTVVTGQPWTSDMDLIGVRERWVTPTASAIAEYLKSKDIFEAGVGLHSLPDRSVFTVYAHQKG